MFAGRDVGELGRGGWRCEMRVMRVGLVDGEVVCEVRGCGLSASSGVVDRDLAADVTESVIGSCWKDDWPHWVALGGPDAAAEVGSLHHLQV